MSDDEVPYLDILPFLKIGQRRTTAAETCDDPPSTSDLLATDSCTCGTLDQVEIVDITPNHDFGLPSALRSVKPRLTIVIMYDMPFGGSKRQKMMECPLCRVILIDIAVGHYLPRSLRRSINLTLRDFWLKHSACARVKEILSKIDSSKSRTRLYGCFTNGASIYEPRIVSRFCDLAIMKSWIHNCMTQHEHCRIKDQVVEGMRLIDCQLERVVRAEPHVRWVALSYVWGKSASSEPRRSESLLDAPQTVKDAMTVAVELGYQYLWVDAYCINQAHGAHKADQISKMDKIYRGAELTIVALGPDQNTGLYGIRHERKTGQNRIRMQERDILAGENPLNGIESSAWWSRGWTLQEGYLSRRLLVFGEQQVTFYCKTSCWTESLSGPETVKEQNNVDWDKLGSGESLYEYKREEPTPLRSVLNFRKLVEQYTKRTLTFDSDILNAFIGIARQLSTSDPPTYNFAGLPYVPWTDAVSREKCIALALTFQHSSNNGVPIRRPGFPSWTWTGWKGLAYWRLVFLGMDEVLLTMYNIRFESADSPGHEESITSELTQSFLESVIAISFDARLVPMDYMVFDEDWSYRDDSEKPLFLKDSVYPICKGIPMSTIAEKLAKGLWSCMILASIVPPRNESLCMVLVYLIEWQDETTAVRLGSTDRQLGLSVFEKLEQRRVRLV